ncbi:MAG: aldehyde dehydrogenase family protein, partial [Pirellulales bacterium]
MSTATTPDIAAIVRQVIAEIAAGGAVRPSAPAPIAAHSSGSFAGANGVFGSVDEAVRAATDAFEQLERLGVEGRKKAIAHIRRIAIDDAEELGSLEFAETKIGRLEHKIGKLKVLGEKVPGVEFMQSEVFSGDHGLTVIEHAPFGVIGAITPVTHSLPTIACNAINMIAGGNTVVVNPHPSGRRIAAEGVRRFNAAIYRDIGVDNLISLVAEPSLESAGQLFNHRGVKLICVTGGPAVA